MSLRDTEPLSARICSHILDSSLFRDAQYLYAYYSLGNEVNVRLVAQTAWQEGKRVAFPKVIGEDMRFFEVTDFGQFAEGAFGIMEPLEAAGAEEVDWMREGEEASGRVPDRAPGRALGSNLLVLVPGVAFDREGNRMGRGKGYYDRYFEDFTGSPDGGAQINSTRSITLLGVAYEPQIADHLPAEPHDLVVPYLVTEEGIIRIGA